MNELLVGLNTAQQSAVAKLDGVLLVLAGAGSGKTRVLTNRIAYLIKNGANPAEILAVTFTNKAAQEMKKRLTIMLGEDIVKNLWVGTFHNICCRILRQDIEKFASEENRKWQSNFVIFDQNDSVSLIKQAIQAEELDEKMYIPKNIQATISMAKNKMIDAYKYASSARDFRSEKIAKIYDNYEKLLSTNNALDFDDLLLLSVNLLAKNRDVVEKYNSRFKHILVDEFQDTNLVQYRLISMISNAGDSNMSYKGRSLCVVGDVDQSIYSWRGADCKIILNFQRDFRNCDLIKLEHNYRSTGTILEVANKIIINNNERLDKKLISTKGKGEKIVCYEAQDEQEEAHYIASKILTLSTTNKTKLNDCVVLYRTNAQSRAVEEAFMSQNIPYKMVGGTKFYDRKEVKDIIAYLKLIYNPDDSQSLKRIINVPKRSIGATTLKKVQDLAAQNDVSMFSVIENIMEYDDFSARTQTALKDFGMIIVHLKSAAKTLPLSEFIAKMIGDIHYLDDLKEEGTEEAESRIENLQEFISVAREYEESTEEPDLGEFLTQVALVSDIDSLQEDNQSVTLMTLHAAKGLEFPVVFLAGLEDGIFPHMRSLQSNTEMEEERRLMYVGVTRAEELLFMSYAKRRLIWGDYKYFTPSRFLREIPQNLLVTIGTDDMLSKPSVKSFKATATEKYGYNSSSFGNSGGSSFSGDKVSDGYKSGFGKDFKLPKIKKASEPAETKPTTVVPITPVPKITETVKPTVTAIKEVKEIQPAVKSFNKPIEIPKPAVKQQTLAIEPVKTQQAVLERPQEKAPEPIEEIKAEKELFKEGDRVFHEKFGVGNVSSLTEMGSDVIYSIDFGKMGIKHLDANYAKLKKF